MKIKSSSYFLMLALAITFAMILSSLTMEAFSARLLPLLFGSVTFILAAVELTRELRSGRTTAENKKATTGVALRRGYIVASMWIGGFFLVVYLLGLIIAGALFVLTYMKVNSTRWFQSIAYAVLATAAIYGIFQYAMEIDLYPGIVFTLFR